MKSVLPDIIQSYIDQVSDQPSTVQQELQNKTASLPMAKMQTSHDQCVLLSMLVASMGASKVLEIGVFTGYSGLAMASVLPDEGKLVACDVNEEWTGIASEFWMEAGVDGKIDLRIAPAGETLESLIKEGESGTFDFVYIDADKKGYEAYYEAALTLIRPNGLIALDNMLWGGEAALEKPEDKLAKVVKDLAQKISADKRVSTCMLGIGDGLFLVRKLS